MLKLGTKIIHFSLAFLVLISSTSFMVSAHYCENEIKSISFFNQAESCGMDFLEKKSNPLGCSSLEKENCCYNRSIFVEGQEDMENIFSGFSIVEPIYFVAFSCFSNLTGSDIIDENGFFKHYSPPLIIRNICLIDQVLLI